MCVRAVRGLLVGSCLMHVCANYTPPPAKRDEPMEGLTTNQWGQSVETITHFHSVNYYRGVPLGVPYTPVARVESSQPGGGGHPQFPCTYMIACACPCVILPPGLPYTPGLCVPRCRGHPDIHLASGPLGIVPLFGGHIASTLNPNTGLNFTQLKG